jgi:hypothetical protein
MGPYIWQKEHKLILCSKTNRQEEEMIDLFERSEFNF